MITKILFALSSILIVGGAGSTVANHATAGLIGLGSLIIGFFILVVTIQYDMKS